MKKRIAILLVLVTVGLSIPAAFSTNDNFSVDYTFELAAESFGGLLVKDTQTQEIPGEPLIPYRAAQILLPQDAVVKDVKVKYDTPIVQTGFDLPWGQPPCTFSDEPVKVERNEDIYNSTDWYPGDISQVVSVESFRGFKILDMILYPIQYQPKSGTVKFYPKMTVTVQFGKDMKNKLYRGLVGDKKDVAGIVDNPEMIQIYEDRPSPMTTEEYIIITNNVLQSTFQQLATWKANFVNGTGVYTVNWIMCHCDGRDTQEKIRNFIEYMYTNHGTEYVLLGGDTGVVPYRGFYISTCGYTDYDMAADMYYAHLDGTFNSDNDSYWAEPGEEDWYAEVAVGRAPVDTTTEAQAFVDKIIDYEQMEKPERVCLHQSRIAEDNDPDSRCLAWNCNNHIPGGYTIDYIFEENATVTKTVWRNAWAAGPIAVAHMGNGDTDSYYINYEEGGTVSWDNSDVSSLTNTFYPWTTSTACICGQFEASDCLAEEYVKDDCGAIGAIYNDNYGWYSSTNACMYSGEFCEMEFRACWDDEYESLGDILNRSRYYMASSASSNTTYRWCFYERNLIGDPETPCLTERDGQTPSPPPLSVEEYIIITNDTLEQTFQKLACWKANFVNGVGVYTVSWIYDNYTGVDEQEQIRNFINYMYTNHDTKYVLLGGDVEEGDPEDSVVPYRGLYVSINGYTETDMPADMYYGHLDGDFDADDDQIYGEPNDNVDWSAEVAVGRAPVETVAEAEAFVNLVITYEQADKPKRVLLHQSRLEDDNDPDSRCLAWNCDDWVPADYVIDYLFEENGTVTKTDWITAWAANPLIIEHMGLGTTTAHYINYKVGGTVSWYNSDVSSLTNTFCPVFMSAADSCGDFRVNDCLAEEYVKKCKAIAAITNADYMWYSSQNACQYSGEFVESFFRALFSDGKEHLGDMLNKGKSYMASSAQGNTTYRWCFYEINLIGDPETPVLTKRKSVSITNPIDGTYVYNNSSVTITTSSTEWVNTVKFYLIYVNDSNQVVGELLCTDTSSPFECSWNPATYPVGKWYTIRAEGLHCGQVKDIDEITVQLLSPSSTLHLRSVGHRGGEGLGTVLLPVLLLCGYAVMVKRH
ncbi:MAG: hypothetical protein HXS46_07390 [Theionarchaea archaeon]|nr:hypothetical protein [Theionarchaea archaeon]